MKNTTYANRGMAFETYIRMANERYRAQKVASIEKLATEFIPIRDQSGKIVSCKVEHKSKVDWLGRFRNIPIAIESKSTFEDSIRFDAVEPHQADYMDEFTEQPGTIGLVLVSFNLSRFYAIPWEYWQAAYNARVRPNPQLRRGAQRSAPASVTVLGKTYDIPRKFSIRRDELDTSWEVPSNDLRYGLHYLKNATKYIKPFPKKEQ